MKEERRRKKHTLKERRSSRSTMRRRGEREDREREREREKCATVISFYPSMWIPGIKLRSAGPFIHGDSSCPRLVQVQQKQFRETMSWAGK
jgi:hypothetical protein